MAREDDTAALHTLFEIFTTGRDLKAVLSSLTAHAGRTFGTVRCFAVLSENIAPKPMFPFEWSSAAFASEAEESLRVISFLRSVRPGEKPLSFSVDSLSSERVREIFGTWGVREVTIVPCLHRGQETLALFLLRQDPLRPHEHDLLQRMSPMIGTGVYNAVSLNVLHTSEAFYREAFENSGLAVAHIDSAGLVEQVNSTFERITGLSIQQVRGRLYRDVLARILLPDERRKVLRRLRAAAAGDMSSEVLVYAVKNVLSGNSTSVLERFVRVSSNDGKPLGWQAMFVPLPAEPPSLERIESAGESRYRRLVEHSDAVIFHTHANHSVHFISRRALDFFGVAAEDFASAPGVPWYELLHTGDVDRVRATVNEMQRAKSSFDEECRVVNRISGRTRWLLIRLVPVLRPDGEIQGWDGFGIDITARRDAQEALDAQSRKIRALYTVSAAIRGYLDPVHIASRGLGALCDAAHADAGACYIRGTGAESPLKLLAESGFAGGSFPKSESALSLAKLAAESISTGQPMVIGDLRRDPRTRNNISAAGEPFESAVFVPILSEGEGIGAVTLLSKKRIRFDGGILMLITAAADQIGLAIRQADLFSLSKRQAKTLSALYRMSHELAQRVSIDDVFRHAFAILRDELGLERLWLGVSSEGGSRIVGQAAYGPGWRRRLVKLNVDISEGDHPLAQVVKTQAPLVLRDPEQSMREIPLRRVFVRLGIHEIALVPLVYSGTVYGVLGVQPASGDKSLREEEVSLLSSLANEIAAVLMAKRLEERIAQSERMRTLGILAGGIAHNFNNLLQAILGQASLLEIERKNPEKVARAAELITEAAEKGASVVRQLITFSQLEAPSPETCDLQDLIRRSQPALEQHAGGNHSVAFRPAESIPRVHADPGQVTRIVAALVSNAADAMPEGGRIEIEIDEITVDASLPAYEVEPGRYVRLITRDSGRGMDDETKRRCFEPFFSTKNVDERTGLSLTGAGMSLAAAFALARRNGGTLAVESDAGTGSTFYLILPVEQPKPPLRDAASSPAELNTPQRKQSAGGMRRGQVLALKNLGPSAPPPGRPSNWTPQPRKRGKT